MIVGIGVDLVAIVRIASILKSEQGQRFVERVLTPEERENWEARASSPAWLAKRWAAKEAVSKALKTGIGAELSFQDMQVVNAPSGAPSVCFSDKGRLLLQRLGIDGVELSLSDEREYALAFAVAKAQSAQR